MKGKRAQFANNVQEEEMSSDIQKKIVKPWQAFLMLAMGIAVIILGLLVLKVNNRIVLAGGGVILAVMAWGFGISYDEIQKSIKDTISSMIVAMLILLAVGTLVATWMAAGTVPVMIYYGMKIITPDCLSAVYIYVCLRRNFLGNLSDRRRGLYGRCTRSWYPGSGCSGRGCCRCVFRR